MDIQSIGYLTVFVSTAGGSVPIEGALVRISREDMEDIVRFTDASGKTEKLPLPAPLLQNSEAPSIRYPFYSYRVSVFKEGFYPQETLNVPVFPEISATQPINLIGISEYNGEELFPTDNTETVKKNPQALDKS